MDNKGYLVKEIQKSPNDLYFGEIEGLNAGKIKAYASEVEIQRIGKHLVYGYSADLKLHRMDNTGKEFETQTLTLPVAQPTSEDKKAYLSMSFPQPNGSRMDISKFPSLKPVFDLNKTAYTNFTIMGKQGLFLVTPIGGLNGLGNGYNSGTYMIVDMESGKPTKAGRFDFPEDSLLLPRDGHLILIRVNNEYEYEFHELTLSNSLAQGSP